MSNEDERLEAQFQVAYEQLQTATSYEGHSRALSQFKELGAQGHLAACTNAGYMLANGLGTQTDHVEARRWLLLAANGGEADAIHNLAVMLWEGMGVQANPAKAIEFFEDAAKKGHAGAQLTLGDAYETGEVLTRDLSQAAAWFRAAAEQGDAGAMFRLGSLLFAGGEGMGADVMALDDAYETGEVFTRDLPQAAAWFRAAAEQGDAGAMFRLGTLLLAGGEGMDADVIEGFHWLKAAADTGNPEWQFLVGFFLEHNPWLPRSGTPRAWYEKAAAQGYEPATQRLVNLYESSGTEDEEHDEEGFSQALWTAALADYYFIGYQTRTFTDFAVIASNPVANAFTVLFERLSISYSSYVHPENKMFIVIDFDSIEEKEKADEYFSSFNSSTRQMHQISMPDIYEGSAEPDMLICQRYQTIIHHYLTKGSERPLQIPVGMDNPTGRTVHAEYTEGGFQGLRSIGYK